MRHNFSIHQFPTSDSTMSLPSLLSKSFSLTLTDSGANDEPSCLINV